MSCWIGDWNFTIWPSASVVLDPTCSSPTFSSTHLNHAQTWHTLFLAPLTHPTHPPSPPWIINNPTKGLFLFLAVSTSLCVAWSLDPSRHGDEKHWLRRSHGDESKVDAEVRVGWCRTIGGVGGGCGGEYWEKMEGKWLGVLVRSRVPCSTREQHSAGGAENRCGV